jgi:tRNA A-37 threonylcarbamoyl transferase component Bud32
MADEPPPPRKTMLYGAIDPPADYPPTIAETFGMATDSGLRIGDKLERYKVGDVLGRGGMGEVLSAHDDQIGRSVAIKRLRIENPTADILARFLREARIQGRLEHPAVVPVHELWHDTGGQPFFVMKQLTGTTLADVLPRLALKDARALEEFPRVRLLRAFTDVCLAIEFAHTRGVVHRDLKPANIVLGDFGEVYVLDWGIARVAGEGTGAAARERDQSAFDDIPTVVGNETAVGAILGTPGYISPEQIRGDADLDGRADVYALGCLLFEILTLQPLHPRGQAGIATALAGVDARPSLRTPERDIPPELDSICVKATAVDRDQRFATARALGDAVQHYLDGNRDIALRKDLAKKELVAARQAMISGDGAVQRRNALRAAARALALDPLDPEPAALVGHLMIEPPREMPAEVVFELDRMDQTALRSSVVFGTFAALAYIAFFPLLYWAGFRETWYLVAGPGVAIFIIVANTMFSARRPVLAMALGAVGNLAMFALLAWIMSPIIVGPGPAIIMITLLAQHRRLVRPWLLALVTAAASLSPWLAELAGWGPARTTIVGHDIIIHTAARQLDATTSIVALAIYIAALGHLAALLSRLQDDERRRVRRTLQLQSWQLRQLVPRPSSIPPSGQ